MNILNIDIVNISVHFYEIRFIAFYTKYYIRLNSICQYIVSYIYIYIISFGHASSVCKNVMLSKYYEIVYTQKHVWRFDKGLLRKVSYYLCFKTDVFRCIQK